jgi:hypothetical protein
MHNFKWRVLSYLYNVYYYLMGANNQPTLNTQPSVEAANKPWPTVKFRYLTVAVSDLATISSIVTDVSFVSCCSKEWVEIGERLATLPQLKTLSVQECDSEDSLCVSICGSKSLTNVRMGELYVIQKTVVCPTKESNTYFKLSS